MYAIIRADLDMTAGKMASQAGHAFLDTFQLCQDIDPERAKEYGEDGHGTKIALYAKNESQILQLYELVKASGIPCALIIDSGHIMPPYFDGNPITTALGIGPARRSEIHHLTKKLQLIK
jgi:PTH2 family peptidyl-tRNA hydrolase